MNIILLLCKYSAYSRYYLISPQNRLIVRLRHTWATTRMCTFGWVYVICIPLNRPLCIPQRTIGFVHLPRLEVVYYVDVFQPF